MDNLTSVDSRPNGLLKVIVKRSEWNGNTLSMVACSSLYNSHTGKRCCLGFAANAAGLDDHLLNGYGYIHNIKGQIPVVLLPLIDEDNNRQSQISASLTAANDNLFGYLNKKFRTMAEKETYIIQHGIKAGIQFEFVD